MERTISASEANQRFSQMLRHVREGDSYVIRAHGEPVARMTPIDATLERQAKGIEDWLDRLEQEPNTQAYGWTREELYD